MKLGKTTLDDVETISSLARLDIASASRAAARVVRFTGESSGKPRWPAHGAEGQKKAASALHRRRTRARSVYAENRVISTSC